MLARREKVEPLESILHLAMVDQNGKAAEVPTSKPHKKRKKSKHLVEETPKKAKLSLPNYHNGNIKKLNSLQHNLLAAKQ